MMGLRKNLILRNPRSGRLEGRTMSIQLLHMLLRPNDMRLASASSPVAMAIIFHRTGGRRKAQKAMQPQI